MVANKQTVLRKEAKEKLEAELRNLIDVELPKVIEELSEARKQGDLSENADYDAARDNQAKIEGRINEIQAILENAKVLDSKPKNVKNVSLGSKVTIKDLSDDSEVTYTIVSSVETNPSKMMISNMSPLGEAIIGHVVGDVCLVRALRPYKVEILKIDIDK